MIISGFFGPQVWHLPVSDIVGYPGLLGSLNMQTVFCSVISAAFFVVHMPFCVYNVYQARKQQNLPFSTTLLEWIPILTFCTSSAAWLLSPKSLILSDNHLVLFALTASFVFGRMTTKIILVSAFLNSN